MAVEYKWDSPQKPHMMVENINAVVDRECSKRILTRYSLYFTHRNLNNGRIIFTLKRHRDAPLLKGSIIDTPYGCHISARVRYTFSYYFDKVMLIILTLFLYAMAIAYLFVLSSYPDYFAAIMFFLIAVAFSVILPLMYKNLRRMKKELNVINTAVGAVCRKIEY